MVQEPGAGSLPSSNDQSQLVDSCEWLTYEIMLHLIARLPSQHSRIIPISNTRDGIAPIQQI